MKTQILLLLCLIGFFVGCRKTSDPVPTADDYYGQYSGTFVTGQGSGNISLTVGKGSSSSELVLLFVDDNGNPLQLKATLTGSTYLLTEKTFYETNSELTYRGDGTFSSNKLKFNLYGSGRERSSSSSAWKNISYSGSGDLTKK